MGDSGSGSNRTSEKLNEMSHVDPEASQEGEEIEDDWFWKLSSGKDGVRAPSTIDSSESAAAAAAAATANHVKITFPCEQDLDFKEKTMKNLRVGLRKIWKRGSATITVEDPTYKVAYLGNVLTGWAKGEGCIEKPLNSLWKNYTESSKPDVQMKITVTRSGLKAVTKEHGLIEYWSHRITYCTVAPELPRVFCWIYRHEGRKLKQELRCHAVLCSKESVAARMAATLKSSLTQALLEFKRSKLLRQNARLSLANSVYDHPSLPRRKILLSTGFHNYKPPLERSKSAPKLMSIEEGLEEEENTPKAKRKFGETEEEVEGTEPLRDGGENRPSRTNLERKCEYKLANLNFVKKLCSSIENLVESTSNYGKKFFAERKSSKDLYSSTKKSTDECLLKKGAREERQEIPDVRTSTEGLTFGVDSVKCPELTLDPLRGPSGRSPAARRAGPPSKGEAERETPLVERLQTYLSTCEEVALLERVVLHPTGCERGSFLGGVQEEEELDEAEAEDRDCTYLELAGNLVKKISLDSKEKDVPYHKLIESAALAQARFQSSCLKI